MKKFIIRILIFIAPVLLLIVATEMVLRNIPNDYGYKRTYLDKHVSEIQVLLLGNSHMYFGVNPEEMKWVGFNASHVSQTLNYDLAILEKYKGKWKSLKAIVVPVDYFSLYRILENTPEKWRAKNYAIYYGINMNGVVWNNFEFLNGKLREHLSRAKKSLINKKNDVYCNAKGFGTGYVGQDERGLDETGKLAAQRHSYLQEDSITFAKNISILQGIIRFSQTYGTKLVFITCPAYKTYVANTKPSQVEKTINTMRNIVAQSGTAAYHNFFTDASFVAEDFYDADHLNRKGASKLTFKIDSIISSMLAPALPSSGR